MGHRADVIIVQATRNGERVMPITIESLLEQAKALPDVDRAELARRLYDTLPPLPESPRPAAAGRAEQGAERLLSFLEKLGRARLVRDRRTLAELRRSLPPVFEEDFDWLARQKSAFADKSGFELENRSDEMGAIALQGPATANFIKDIL